eukprot:COSAG06_NODE_65182_length_257_cov_1.493671_1_plen_57_part_01
MVVPSLSWQMFKAFEYTMAQQKRAFPHRVTAFSSALEQAVPSTPPVWTMLSMLQCRP